MAVVVIGADNRVGSAIARSLAESQEVKILLPSDATVHGEYTGNAKVEHLDVDSPGALQAALAGARACVIHLDSDLAEPQCVARDVKRGKMIGQALLQARVSHVIYSTEVSVSDAIGVRARHMDAKADVFQMYKDMGIPTTGLVVPTTYETLIEPPLRPHRCPEDRWRLAIPMCRNQLCMISEADIGPVVAAILNTPSTWLGKSMAVCGDKLLVREVASVLTQASGMNVVDAQITPDEWRQMHCRVAGIDDLTNMFIFYDRVDQRANVHLTQQLHPHLNTLKDWAHKHSAAIKEALNYQLEEQESYYSL